MKTVTLEQLRSIVRSDNPQVLEWFKTNPSFNGIVSKDGDLYVSAGFDARQRDDLKKLLKQLKFRSHSVTVERGIFDSYIAAPNGYISSEKVENKSLREVINRSITERATDIHINIKSKRAYIDFKIDGFLYEHQRLDTSVCYKLVNSLFQSRIGKNFEVTKRMDEEFAWDFQDRSFIFRVHSEPGFHGTIVVLRAREQNKVIEIVDGGYHASHQETLKLMCEPTTGFSAIAGITNSGKSNLYAALLTALPRQFSKIELANPIEMEIEGVEQIPLAGESDEEIAEVLRGVVRMDPNYLFMGEMRGKETAKLVESLGIIGTAVFTTVHAGNAELFFPRLLDVGISKTNLLLGDFFNGFMVQTLMPRICHDCKTTTPLYVDPDIADKLVIRYQHIFQKEVYFRNPEGCSVCNGKGTIGQIVVAEGFVPDYTTNDFYDIIKHNKFNDIRERYMKPRNILGQMEHAGIHVYQGIIDPVEVERKRAKFDAESIKEAFKWAL